MKYNNKKNLQKEKRLKEVQMRLRVFHIICACIMGMALLMYFCEFFRLNIDGNIQNRINGFQLSFILMGDSLQDSDNILTLLNKKYAEKIAFAAVSSSIALFVLLAFTGLLIYRASTKKPLLSNSVLVFIGIVLIALIIQITACSLLASFVTQYSYSGCATCIAQTMSYFTLIMFILFMVVYASFSYWLYYHYGIAFKAE